MVRITESLIRKRAEHNEGEISTLEEVSLHQYDIEKIEWIDKWCKDLKILYLQSNLIAKIENVGKLKKLEYLNLALNNVERVENLEGCESLQKLDLTVNFVGELTSIECLKDLYNFREMYMTGNPCAQYDGYRDFVIATLTQLKYLDGQEIEKSERIKAIQNYDKVRVQILKQQSAYMKEREKEKQKATAKKEGKPGFDGRWYTDINNTSEGETKVSETPENEDNDETNDKDLEEDQKFWNEEVPFTPESRISVHEHMKKVKEKEEKKYEDPTKVKRERRLMTDDGKMLNVNEPKIDFFLNDNEEENQYELDLTIYKYLDTSMLDVDVQTDYVRVTIKGKIFQLALTDEVLPDSSSAKRSQITGHLLITMPKANPILRPKHVENSKTKDKSNSKESGDKSTPKIEKLEIDPSKNKTMDFANIVQDKPLAPPLGTRPLKKVEERANSEDFIDDPDVPPLM